MKVLFGISLALNVALAVLLALAHGSTPEPPAASAMQPTQLPLCARLPTDLDFFIEGLLKGRDPFYSPLTVRFLEPVLLQCQPEHTEEIKRVLPQLREHLLQIVAANVPDATKRSAHDQALKIFRDLRALFGTNS